MSFSDLKFFLLVAVLGVVGYGLLFTNGAWKRYQRGAWEPPPTPTVTFVPAGTPGAKTWEQFQEERYPQWRRR